jgi:hypothetical protein
VKNNQGSITIQTIAIIFLLSAIGFGSFLIIHSTFTRFVNRVENYDGEVDAFAEILKDMIQDIEKDTSPNADSSFDSYFTIMERNNIISAIYDISSALNPNWIRKQPLQETKLRELLIIGANADGLQQYREDYGFSQNINDFYKPFFSEKTCELYLTPWSYANINNTDEFALRALFARITGNITGAEAFHSKIQTLLIEQKILKEVDLMAFLGADAGKLAGLITTRPQWNVNFLDPLLLSSILSYPGYKISQPQKKTEQIISEREYREISFNRLKDICELKEDHPIFSYLGSETFFWRVMLKRYDKTLMVVLARDLTVPPSQKKIMVVSVEYI